MSQGFLGSADLGAATITSICTINVTTQTINILLCNRNASAIAVRVAITSGGAPAAKDYLQYDMPVPANGTSEITGIPVSSGEVVYAYSSLASVSACVRGLTVVA